MLVVDASDRPSDAPRRWARRPSSICSESSEVGESEWRDSRRARARAAAPPPPPRAAAAAADPAAGRALDQRALAKRVRLLGRPAVNVLALPGAGGGGRAFALGFAAHRVDALEDHHRVEGVGGVLRRRARRGGALAPHLVVAVVAVAVGVAVGVERVERRELVARDVAELSEGGE